LRASSTNNAGGLTTPNQPAVDTQNAYDDLGRLTRIDLRKPTEANWTFSSYAYDAANNITDAQQNGQETTPNGTLVKAGQQLHYDYDGANWLADQVDSTNNRRVLTSFTPVGLESRSEQDKGNGAGGWTPTQVTTWDYFANGKLNHLTTTNGTSSTPLESHTVSYLDTSGIYVDGNRTQDSFTQRPPTGSTPACPTACIAQYTYDPRDRLVSENNGHGSTTNYTLDGPGNIVSETGSTTSSYTYTNNFQLSSQTINGTKTLYWYDDLGRLSCATTIAGSQADCGKTTSPPTSLVGNYRYDYLDRVGLFQGFSSSMQTDSASYTYDALNRIASETETHPGLSAPRTTQLSYFGQTSLPSEEQLSTSGTTTDTRDYTYDSLRPPADAYRYAVSERHPQQPDRVRLRLRRPRQRVPARRSLRRRQGRLRLHRLRPPGHGPDPGRHEHDQPV